MSEPVAGESTATVALRRLLHQAASLESDATVWAARFERLFADHTVRFVALPGSELAVSPSAGAAGDSRLQQLVRTAGGGVELDVGVRMPARSGGAVLPTVAGIRWLPCIDAAGLAARDGLPAGRFACRYGLPGRDTTRAHWRELVTLSHRLPGMIPVPESGSRPLTALHSAETGQAVLPRMLLDVRSASAWLCLELDARQLGAPASLRRIVGDCLRLADNLIDAVRWPLPELRLDALLNRRVALSVGHLGDAMLAAGWHPRAAGTYARLQRWLGFLRGCFVHESVQLAVRRGPFPSLCAAELMEVLAPRYGLGNARRLLRNRLLRHRHLLALSPFSLLPAAAGSSAAHWVDLIPAIACADSICMTGHQQRCQLDLPGWQRLLQLTAAVAAGGVRNSGRGAVS